VSGVRIAIRGKRAGARTESLTGLLVFEVIVLENGKKINRVI
jgi:hypothetical protein